MDKEHFNEMLSEFFKAIKEKTLLIIIDSASKYEKAVFSLVSFRKKNSYGYGYNNYDERDAIISAFQNIYNDSLESVSVIDYPWEEEEKFYLPMIDNEEYDQETIMQEYNALLERKAA